MSERKINLEEILAKWVSKNLQEYGRSREASDAVAKTSIKDGSYWYILEAMKEFGKQLLELASENAKFKFIEITNDGGEILIAHDQEHRVVYSDEWIEIDKQSILDTIKQVE